MDKFFLVRKEPLVTLEKLVSLVLEVKRVKR